MSTQAAELRRDLRVSFIIRLRRMLDCMQNWFGRAQLLKVSN